MKQLAFTKSRHALTVGFGALLVLIIVVTLLGISRIYTINQRIEALVYEQNFKSELLATLLTVSQQRQQIMYQLFSARDAAQRNDAYQKYQALVGPLFATLDRLEDMEMTESERAAVNQALGSAARSQEVRDRVVALLMQDNAAGAAELLLQQGLSAQDRFQESLNRLIDSKRTAAVEAVSQASLAMREAWLLVALVGILVLVLGGWVASAVIRQIVRSQDALHREKELAQVTLHSIGDGVITTDANGLIDYLNPVAEQYTGWSGADARGQPLGVVYRVLDEHTGKPVPHPGGNSTGAHGTHGITVRLLGRSGNACAVRDSSSPIHNSEGNLVGWVVVFHDVSQIEEMAQQLTWQASHDPLTGLVNRREFERRLADLIDAARNDNKQHALMYMDLDNFKIVNDTCGHTAGDELLRQLTTVMQARMRGSDTLARIGGDEFGVLLESCPLDQAVRIANGMREAVRDFRFVWEDKTFGVGASAGLVAIDGVNSASRVLATADAVCYEAKSKGRDRVQVYRPKDGASGEHDGELQMVSQINHAFELGNFRLYRQKIIALGAADRDAPHYEVLVRMVDRAGSLIPPSGFMPAAERYNLLSSIERWVISSLVEFLHRQYESGAIAHEKTAFTSAFYAVNLSGVSINDNSFTDFLGKLLTRFNLPRGLLCFEVTETTAISNLTKAAQLMHDLKAMGCRFALDDFGIGMSSFAYLKYLPVDYIKIDGVFVRDMATDPMDHAIVEAINRIAHILGLKTVAEFVEEETTLERLRAIGVDYAQGYFVAKPEAIAKSADTEHAVLESA
ncbi:MAG: EAL domain-containing protein [Betaproteobacteria bacterium]|nr:EAL domain-containing protein [Betaproteobacteria bacterium]